MPAERMGVGKSASAVTQRELLLFGGEGAPVFPPGTLFVDTFTEAVEIGLDAHTPDFDLVGGGWTEDSGVWEVSDSVALNALRNMGGAGEQGFASADVGTSNQDLTVTVTLISGDAIVGPNVRYTDSANRLVLVLFAGTDTISIFKVVGGAATEIDTAPLTIGILTPYKLRLIMGADNIAHGFVDDVELVSAAAADVPLGTRFAFEVAVSGSSRSVWDNLTVIETA